MSDVLPASADEAPKRNRQSKAVPLGPSRLRGTNYRLGPYSTQAAVQGLDQRTREGRLMRQVRKDLIAHLGGNPSVTQRVMIDRAAWLSLRLALLDAKILADTFTEHDSRTYIAWDRSLNRLMRDLGLKGAAQAPRSLREHLAAKAGA